MTTDLCILTIQRKYSDGWETVTEIRLPRRLFAMAGTYPTAWYDAKRSPWRHRLLLKGKEVART